MRIGFVTGEYPPMQGGIGAHCRVLAKTLVKQGHEVFIFSDEKAHADDPQIHLTRKQGKWRAKTLKEVNQWAKDNRLDVVNLHYQTAAYNMSPWIHFSARYLKAAPLITTFHDLRFPYLFPKAGPFRTWIVRHLAKTSAGVISTNHEDASKLAYLRLNALIPIGSSVDTQLPSDYERTAFRAQYNATPDEIVIAHFGFINHSKGVDTLLESVAALYRANKPVKLLMIGGKTGSSDPSNVDYARLIDQKITDLAIYHLVHWTGFVDDQQASAYLNSADLVVLPFRDGASYRRSSLMAAIANERPIITTKPAVDIPAFKNAHNLLLISPERPATLSAAIQVLVSDEQLRNTLCEGVKALKSTFDWDHIARENSEFFEHVIRQHKK